MKKTLIALGIFALTASPVFASIDDIGPAPASALEANPDLGITSYTGGIAKRWVDPLDGSYHVYYSDDYNQPDNWTDGNGTYHTHGTCPGDKEARHRARFNAGSDRSTVAVASFLNCIEVPPFVDPALKVSGSSSSDSVGITTATVSDDPNVGFHNLSEDQVTIQELLAQISYLTQLIQLYQQLAALQHQAGLSQ